MATYQELFALTTNSNLTDKIAVAGMKKAQSLLDASTPTNAEVAWASATINDPTARARSLINYVLAKNSGSTTVAILAATDVTIQGNVDSAADALIAGGIA